MATTLKSTPLNLAGVSGYKLEIVWDNTDLNPTLEHGGPKDSAIVSYTELLTAQPTDNSSLQIAADFVTNASTAEVILDAQSGGSAAGATSTLFVQFADEADQDGSSIS